MAKTEQEGRNSESCDFITDVLLCEGPYLLSGLRSIRQKDQPEMGPHLVCFGGLFKEEEMAESRKVTRGSWGEWIINSCITAVLSLQRHHYQQNNSGCYHLLTTHYGPHSFRRKTEALRGNLSKVLLSLTSWLLGLQTSAKSMNRMFPSFSHQFFIVSSCCPPPHHIILTALPLT